MVEMVRKFKVGEHLKLSEEALRRHVFLTQREFVVVGFCRDKNCVRVIRKGGSPKSVYFVHENFLEKVGHA